MSFVFSFIIHIISDAASVILLRQHDLLQICKPTKMFHTLPILLSLVVFFSLVLPAQPPQCGY